MNKSIQIWHSEHCKLVRIKSRSVVSPKENIRLNEEILHSISSKGKSMKLRMFIIAVLVFAILSAPFGYADWRWQRVRCNGGSCGYTYQRVFVPQVVKQVVPQITQKTETQTTVVNNLIGIPVPVTYNQPIQAQGTTVYGYSSVAEAYGQIDMGLLYNQAARLTDQAQQLAGQASSDFATLVQAEGQNRAEVARIIAQGQAARQALEAAQGYAPQQQIQSRTFAFRVTQDGEGQINVQQVDDQQVKSFDLISEGSSTNVSDLLKSKCLACHSNGNAQGGLNLEQAITDEQQAKILSRVITDDFGKRMPKNSDGTAGQKLSVSELRLLFNAMSDQK